MVQNSYSADAPEVSIVMPCLNEAETVEACIKKAQSAFTEHGIAGEVIIADNGSTDGSQALAERLGARVVPVEAKGYGNALRGGIAAARGKYVLMGDADDSYDFSAIQPHVEKLREGYGLVMGNRFRGGIMPGAMPWKHRWIGNPVLSWVGRLFFHCPVGDFHCGLRGFSKEAYVKMDLQTGGMEFASEMVIKSTMMGISITEVPIVLHKDGRTRPPHLRSWRDGWRHLRFMLMFSPRWLFLIPGLLLFVLGAVSSCILIRGPVHIGSVELDIHTLVVTSFSTLLGYQLIVFALFTKILAIATGLHPIKPSYEKWFKAVSLEWGVAAGVVMIGLGVLLLAVSIWGWGAAEFGGLDPQVTMRRIVPGVSLMVIGAQTLFSSFFLSMLGMIRKQTRSAG